MNSFTILYKRKKVDDDHFRYLVVTENNDLDELNFIKKLLSCYNSDFINNFEEHLISLDESNNDMTAIEGDFEIEFDPDDFQTLYEECKKTKSERKKDDLILRFLGVGKKEDKQPSINSLEE